MRRPPDKSFNPLDYPLCLTPPRQVDALSWHEHIPFAMTLVQLLSPRVIVELGVHTGDSYLAFCQAVATTGGHTTVYGVDTWRGDSHADFYGQEVLDRLRRHHDPIYGGFSRLLQCTFDEAAEHFTDGSVDLLHVDGFHSYEAVSHDWQTWRPKLSTRGVALFHDTNIRERDFGVWRLWEELVARYPHLHFVHGHGLGVLAVGPDAAALLGPLLAADEQRRATLRDFFFQLGSRLTLATQKATLEAQLSARDSELAELRQKAEEGRAEISHLKQSLAAQNARVTALMSSASWRLTAPIRWIQTKVIGRVPRDPLGRLLEAAPLLSRPWRLFRRIDEIRRMLTTDLFDGNYYRAAYPDVAQAARNPRLHYVVTGAHEGRNPNALFNSHSYLKDHAEVEAAGLSPLYHYIRFGAREGRDPGPLFNTPLFVKENPHLRTARVIPLAQFLRSLPAGQDPRETPFAFRSWLARYDVHNEAEPLRVRWRLEQLPRQPSVSLLAVTPVDANRTSLEEMIESVRAQLYDKWELVLALPPGAHRDFHDTLSDLSKVEPRIRIVKGQNAEPAGMLREVAAEARGDFVAVVEHDDLLDERALYLLAEEIARQPDAVAVYSDEDEVDQEGRRCNPHFKPNWSRDLFHGWNFLGSFVFLDRSLVEEVGGFRDTHALSHEYDLLLRVTGVVDDSRVRHIPRILCHRRSKTARRRGGASSPEEAASAVRALADHLKRSGTPATAELVGEHFHRAAYRLPDELPLVSIIVPTRDRLNLLKPCLSSVVEKTDYARFEILVIDNDSSDPGTLTFLRSLKPPHRVLDYQGEFNHSAINNFAARRAEGSILLFLNNDTEVRNPSWLTEMVRLAARDDVGAVGAKLYFSDDTVQHAGVIVGMRGVAGHSFAGLPAADEGYYGRAVLTQDYSAVTGACLAMRRSVFEEVGGFDEDAFPVNFNDVDLCLRVRASGRKVLFCAQAELVHHEGASRNSTARPNGTFRGESSRFRARWAETIEDDPFYNPNLSLAERPFLLAVPPRARWPCEEGTASRPTGTTATLDPYAAADNWGRAAVVQAQPQTTLDATREWRRGLSLVILTLDGYELIAPLLDQLLAARSALGARGLEIQVIVGDTGSKDERVLRKYEELSAEIVVVRGLRYHFSRCNNRLFFEQVAFDKVLFLNNDIIFTDAVESLLALAEEIDDAPSVGVAGAVLTYPDGRVQHAGVDFVRSGPQRGLPYHPHHREPAEALGVVARASDCPAVTGACLAIRSSLFADLGGFDEGYRTECQDAALCLAAWRLGYRCRLVPAGRIDHLENGTRPAGSEDWVDRQRFVRRWRSFVEAQTW